MKGIILKDVKGMKEVSEEFKRLANEHYLEIYYDKNKNKICSSEFISAGSRLMFEFPEDYLVLGFVQKGRDRVSQKRIREALKYALNATEDDKPFDWWR